MLRVTIVNLSPETLGVDISAGTTSLGEVDEAQFVELLEVFRTLPAMQVVEAEPQIIVESRHGKHIIRTGQEKLFLYDARESMLPYVELTAGEICQQLSASAVSTPEAAADIPDLPARTPHRGIAVTMLVAGLCLNGYTLYSVFYIDDVNQKPAIKLIVDSAELATRQSSVAGRYATGSDAGDRFIIVRTDGTVHFGEIGTRRPESDDTYRIGRHDDQLCLTTPDSGVIDVTGPSTVVYYRDTYRRVN